MSRRIRPWLWLLLLAPLIAGWIRLRFDTDVLNLLPGNLPVVHGLKLYQRNFTDSRELIITVRGSDAGQTEAAARALAEMLRAKSNLVSSVLWQPAWLERPVEAAELIGFIWLNQPPDIFAELTNRLVGTHIDITLAEAREQLATSLSPLDLARRGYDPFNLMVLPEGASATGAASFGTGENLFASPDGTFRILFVKARPDLGNYRACIEWLRNLNTAIQAERTSDGIPSDVKIAFTGGPAFVAEISGGMEHDMTSSVGITSAIIAVLFWIFHRRWVPMVWLLLLLMVILSSTLALGGLIFGAVNVVSLGFAGILLGLAVDYGVVHYQEAMASPQATIPEIRRAIGPSIFWAAVTTISAFLVLNFGGLPGLAQLGSLVAIGVMLSALVMLFAFLPPLFRNRAKKRNSGESSGAAPAAIAAGPIPAVNLFRQVGVLSLTFVLLVFVAGVLMRGVPGMDETANALRPQHSPAYSSLDEIKTELGQNREPLWLIAEGHNEEDVAQRLATAQPVLARAVSNQVLSSFTLPTMLWPQAKFQTANRVAVREILAERDALQVATLAAGFSTNSLRMTDAIFDAWQSALGQRGVYWPTNEMSRWVLEKVAAHQTNDFLAVGFLFPQTNSLSNHSALETLSTELGNQGLILSGWDLLGPSILNRVERNLWKVLPPMALLVLLSLWLAFRRPSEMVLSLAVLLMSGLGLLAVMQIAGWSWNLLNLMALPLLLGSGVDYSIFMQLALRRHFGDLAGAHRAVGRALLLCGGTTIAGFGSLAFSTNAGMASLGEVCAVGIAFNMVISVYLLPIWWRATQNSKLKTQNLPLPSSLYRAEFWRAGLWLVRLLPRGFCIALARLGAAVYWRLAKHRREIVVQNLMPAVANDREAAMRKARESFQQFAVKIIDLWLYEAGLPVEEQLGTATGWEHFEAARATGRGVLLITPHLGNWEFGGPWLTPRGMKLHVITLAEPGEKFTGLRQASRARWNIETLVIGNDPFAFLEIIKLLEAGATVALLVDRPPPPTAVEVELFGQPFAASIAAAELARASGCVLLPVYIPREGECYSAHILPPISYQRAALRDHAVRQQLTQEIMRAFEPAIRQHLDQWFHFVPIWPKR